jgi:hypothetical protein
MDGHGQNILNGLGSNIGKKINPMSYIMSDPALFRSDIESSHMMFGLLSFIIDIDSVSDPDLNQDQVRSAQCGPRFGIRIRIRNPEPDYGSRCLEIRIKSQNLL